MDESSHAQTDVAPVLRSDIPTAIQGRNPSILSGRRVSLIGVPTPFHRRNSRDEKDGSRSTLDITRSSLMSLSFSSTSPSTARESRVLPPIGPSSSAPSISSSLHPHPVPPLHPIGQKRRGSTLGRPERLPQEGLPLGTSLPTPIEGVPSTRLSLLHPPLLPRRHSSLHSGESSMTAAPTGNITVAGSQFRSRRVSFLLAAGESLYLSSSIPPPEVEFIEYEREEDSEKVDDAKREKEEMGKEDGHSGASALPLPSLDGHLLLSHPSSLHRPPSSHRSRTASSSYHLTPLSPHRIAQGPPSHSHSHRASSVGDGSIIEVENPLSGHSTPRSSCISAEIGHIMEVDLSISLPTRPSTTNQLQEEGEPPPLRQEHPVSLSLPSRSMPLRGSETEEDTVVSPPLLLPAISPTTTTTTSVATVMAHHPSYSIGTPLGTHPVAPLHSYFRFPVYSVPPNPIPAQPSFISDLNIDITTSAASLLTDSSYQALPQLSSPPTPARPGGSAMLRPFLISPSNRSPTSLERGVSSMPAAAMKKKMKAEVNARLPAVPSYALLCSPSPVHILPQPCSVCGQPLQTLAVSSMPPIRDASSSQVRRNVLFPSFEEDGEACSGGNPHPAGPSQRESPFSLRLPPPPPPPAMLPMETAPDARQDGEWSSRAVVALSPSPRLPPPSKHLSAWATIAGSQNDFPPRPPPLPLHAVTLYRCEVCNYMECAACHALSEEEKNVKKRQLKEQVKREKTAVQMLLHGSRMRDLQGSLLPAPMLSMSSLRSEEERREAYERAKDAMSSLFQSFHPYEPKTDVEDLVVSRAATDSLVTYAASSELDDDTGLLLLLRESAAEEEEEEEEESEEEEKDAGDVPVPQWNRRHEEGMPTAVPSSRPQTREGGTLPQQATHTFDDAPDAFALSTSSSRASFSSSISSRSSRSSASNHKCHTHVMKPCHWNGLFTTDINEPVVANKTFTSEGNRIINDYVVVKMISRGSFATVKLVQHVHTGELFALKILKKFKKRGLTGMQGKMRENLESEQKRISDELLREIAVMRLVNHPNIVKLQEVIDDVEEEKIYIIMEYCPGGPIHVLGKPALPVEKVRLYGAQLASALLYLHSEFLYHRDVKPANVLVDAKGVAKLVDFGTCNSRIRTNMTAGTPAYSCPELVRGEEVGGDVVDSWAFAVTLFQMAYGELPYPNHLNTFSLRQLQLTSVPIVIPWYPADGACCDLLSQMLQKDLRHRLLLQQAVNHDFFRSALTPLSIGLGRLSASLSSRVMKGPEGHRSLSQLPQEGRNGDGGGSSPSTTPELPEVVSWVVEGSRPVASLDVAMLRTRGLSASLRGEQELQEGVVENSLSTVSRWNESRENGEERGGQENSLPSNYVSGAFSRGGGGGGGAVGIRDVALSTVKRGMNLRQSINRRLSVF